MTKAEFQVVLQQTFDRMRELTASKGEEYARDVDQLANFKRNAADCNISIPQAWGVLFTKHMDAIKFFIQTGKVLSEAIESRIDDAILYLILLRAIVIEKRMANGEKIGTGSESKS